MSTVPECRMTMQVKQMRVRAALTKTFVQVEKLAKRTQVSISIGS